MEWKECQIKDVCRLINGRAYSNGEMLEHGKYKIVRVGNLSGGNSTWFYSDLELSEDKYCHNGDLLFAWACTFGPHIWKEDNTIFHYHIWKIVEDKNVVDRRFYYYYLKYATGGFLGALNGSVMVHITKASMEKMNIKIPKNLDDQRRIASILSSLDRKIELNNKINADLEEMAQAIFKNWFVDFEPFKDGKFVDSELGMIPEGWKVGTLDEIFSLKYGKNLSTSMILEKGDYPVYGANGIIGYYNEFNCDKYSVLVTSRGNGSGDVSRTHHPKSFITNNSFVVEPLEHYKYIKLPFINGLFNIIDFKSYCSGSAQPQLTNKAMRNICIISPPRELVIKYCEILETLFSHIECVIDENSRLSLLRDTLLPRLMSGEIEVPE